MDVWCVCNNSSTACRSNQASTTGRWMVCHWNCAKAPSRMLATQQLPHALSSHCKATYLFNNLKTCQCYSACHTTYDFNIPCALHATRILSYASPNTKPVDPGHRRSMGHSQHAGTCLCYGKNASHNQHIPKQKGLRNSTNYSLDPHGGHQTGALATTSNHSQPHSSHFLDRNDTRQSMGASGQTACTTPSAIPSARRALCTDCHSASTASATTSGAYGNNRGETDRRRVLRSAAYWTNFTTPAKSGSAQRDNGTSKSESSSNQKRHIKSSTHPRARINRGSRLNHTIRSHESIHRQGSRVMPMQHAPLRHTQFLLWPLVA